MGNECAFNKLGEVSIKKLKINDVSSHYSQGKFILCVFCKNKYSNFRENVDSKEVKPLIMPNIRVKSH